MGGRRWRAERGECVESERGGEGGQRERGRVSQGSDSCASHTPLCQIDGSIGMPLVCLETCAISPHSSHSSLSLSFSSICSPRPHSPSPSPSPSLLPLHRPHSPPSPTPPSPSLSPTSLSFLSLFHLFPLSSPLLSLSLSSLLPPSLSPSQCEGGLEY